MDKVKAISLTETSAIKLELKSTITLVKKINQGQRRPIESLKSKLKSLKRGMIYAPRLEHWSEDMDSAITLIMELLGDWMNYLDINTSTGGGGVGVGITELVAFEDKWDGKMNEVADGIDGVAVFSRRRWFWSRMECVNFAEKHIPAGQFQWFLDILS